MPDTLLDEYVAGLLGGEDQLLRQIRGEAQELGLPMIQVPQELARLLTVLVHACSARRILEVGTLFGYSAIAMARALPPGGTLISLEANPRHVQLARDNVKRAGLDDRVDIREGPAVDSLGALAGSVFDLVFIDADKASYPDYLEWALRLTRPGGVIIADNVWRAGKVLDPGDDRDAQGASTFNRRLAANGNLAVAYVPTRGGDDAAAIAVVRES
jgi:predicted O-methyltransferase YrrM